jgi:2-hydroxymuconate-semialdehyde hydrolase
MKQRTITISGLETNYYDLGEGKAVVFLHGGAVDALTFKQTILFLSQSYRVIAPDLPCFGQTETPKRIWDFYNYADFIKHFLKELGVDKYSIVGHSMGGGIALHTSLSNPSVEKLVLVSSAGVKVDYSTLRFLYQFFIRKIYTESILSGKPAIVKIQMQGSFRSFRNHLPSFFRVLRIIKKCLRSNTPDLSRVDAKTLILWGDKDELLPVRYAYKLKEGIKNSELKIFNGNHSWCMFHADDFHKELLEFLK